MPAPTPTADMRWWVIQQDEDISVQASPTPPSNTPKPGEPQITRYGAYSDEATARRFAEKLFSRTFGAVHFGRKWGG